MNRKLINKKDILIIIIMLVLAAIIYIISDKFVFTTSKQAEIIYNNNVIQTVTLKGNYTFSPKDFPNIVFQVKDGAIAFISSDCPDKICVHTGFINKTGQSAVCLPNKMIIRLKSDSGSPDALL